MRKTLSLILLSFILTGTISAQMPDLKGKKVAIYFSKKQFTFDGACLLPLAQFLSASGKPNATSEDIKLHTLIQLGRQMPSQLKFVIGADSVFFLNANPKAAKDFISNYNDAYGEMNGPLGKEFKRVDYVFVINPMQLGAYKTSSVYAYSNRIITEQQDIFTSRINLDIIDTQTGKVVHSKESCFDERETNLPEDNINLHSKTSRMGKFMGHSFSYLFYNLVNDRISRCPEPEEAPTEENWWKLED